MTKIDITSTAIEKSIDLVKGFLEKISGAAIEETGLMFADNIKLRRFKNQLKIFSKAKILAEESGLNIKQLSLKTLVPLVELSSLEEDEFLQDKWSNLIVNFIDSNEAFESAIFPFILSQISSEEAILLDAIRSSLYDTRDLKPEIIENLFRLGVIDKEINQDRLKFTRGTMPSTNRKIWLTEMGLKFVKCCNNKDKKG